MSVYTFPGEVFADSEHKMATLLEILRITLIQLFCQVLYRPGGNTCLMLHFASGFTGASESTIFFLVFSQH